MQAPKNKDVLCLHRMEQEWCQQSPWQKYFASIMSAMYNVPPRLVPHDDRNHVAEGVPQGKARQNSYRCRYDSYHDTSQRHQHIPEKFEANDKETAEAKASQRHPAPENKPIVFPVYLLQVQLFKLLPASTFSFHGAFFILKKACNTTTEVFKSLRNRRLWSQNLLLTTVRIIPQAYFPQAFFFG